MIDCVDIFKANMINEELSWESAGVDARTCSLKMVGIKNLFLIKCLSSIIGFLQFLISILSILIVSLKVVKANIFFKSNNGMSVPKGQRLFMVFTPLFLSRLNHTDIKDDFANTIWMVGPNIKGEVRLPEAAKKLSWDSHQKRIDFWKSYIEVVKICVKYPFSTKMVFPIYRYWELCLVAKSLERITEGNDLYFSNQMDRWAMLFDRLPSSSKTLLQHGIDIEYGGRFVKLKNIDHFYAISKGTWQNSYKYLLGCKPELHIMEPTIELSDISTDKFSILIISHIIYFETEKKIIEELKDFPVQIYVKKHPTVVDDEVYRELQEKCGFVYITDNTFPRVDYVISYESTLAYEYMNFDVPVKIYSPENPIDIDELVYELNSLNK